MHACMRGGERKEIARKRERERANDESSSEQGSTAGVREYTHSAPGGSACRY